MPDDIKLALVHIHAGELEKASAILSHILNSTPATPTAWYLSAAIQLQKNNVKQAISLFEEALRYQANYPEALKDLGIALSADNQFEKAKNCYEKAIILKNDYASAYYNLANIQKNEKNFDDAIQNYLLAIKYKPDYCNALNNLALIYQANGNYRESESLLTKALNISENDHEIMNNLGYNYYCDHQYDNALNLFNHILRSAPSYGPTLLNFGLLMLAMGSLAEAKHTLLKLSYNPRFHHKAMNNLAQIELSKANFETGWQYYRHRPSVRTLSFKTPDRLPDNLEGKSLLLYKDQGIGDEIFLARYIPILQQYNAALSYYSSEKLSTIWQRNLPNIKIVTTTPNLDDFDFVISLGDLPRLLYQNGYTDIPPPISLQPHSDILKNIKNMLPNNRKKNIAATWEAGKKNHNTLFKRISPEILGQHLSSLDANILVIQREPKSKDIKLLEQNLGERVYNYSFANENLEEMLALLALVDDYVCVSNTNNHLRNSLHLSSQVFVPHPPEWRWSNEGQKTRWFPNSKILRQKKSGDWDNCFDNKH